VIGDLELQRDVLDELEFEPSINAAHIGVTANKGVVTLTGFVTSYAEKLAAERAARRVKGEGDRRRNRGAAAVRHQASG
jgi:osmotically-inducible protein OsmY